MGAVLFHQLLRRSHYTVHKVSVSSSAFPHFEEILPQISRLLSPTVLPHLLPVLFSFLPWQLVAVLPGSHALNYRWSPVLPGSSHRRIRSLQRPDTAYRYGGQILTVQRVLLPTPATALSDNGNCRSLKNAVPPAQKE